MVFISVPLFSDDLLNVDSEPNSSNWRLLIDGLHVFEQIQVNSPRRNASHYEIISVRASWKITAIWCHTQYLNLHSYERTKGERMMRSSCLKRRALIRDIHWRHDCISESTVEARRLALALHCRIKCRKHSCIRRLHRICEHYKSLVQSCVFLLGYLLERKKTILRRRTPLLFAAKQQFIFLDKINRWLWIYVAVLFRN